MLFRAASFLPFGENFSGAVSLHRTDQTSFERQQNMRSFASGEQSPRFLPTSTFYAIRHPRIVDAVTCLAACAAALLALGQAHHSGLVPSFWGSVLVVLLASSTLLLRRTTPMLPMAAAVLSTLASEETTLLLFAAYALGSYGGRIRWTGIAMGGLLYTVIQTWTEPSPGLFAMMYDVIVKFCFPAALGELTRRRREVTWLLQQRLVAVEHAVDQAAHQAVVDERTRLAFDIHDGLGHRATVLIFQAQALRTTPGMPPKASDLASTVEEGAREILDDMRGILDVLRGVSDPSGRGETAYAQFAAALVSNLTAAGIDVSFHRTGTPRLLSPGVDNVLRSCGREALTNAVKHGHGAPISLHLEFSAQEVGLEVTNGPGTAAPLSPLTGGLGMISMQEQVSRARGRLQAGPTANGGFRVHIALPAPQAADTRDHPGELHLEAPAS
ncbi:sensor histidine kinase [Streptomyces sp. x-19]|uniref:sensor histidine kinase n=1 Tax=Streptomyces sp. x-19 TaxID=2789280 RepID=UPI0039814E29